MTAVLGRPVPPAPPPRHAHRPALLDRDLHLLAARVGSTPFFGYDRTAISARVAEVRAAMPTRTGLHYAVKANPMPALLAHLAGKVDGFDVASGGELRAALDTGTAPERIGFAGPGKTDAELAQAAAAGVTVEVESPGELDRLAAAGDRVGVRPQAALRINPDFVVRGAGLRMGGGPAPFGIDAEQAPAVLAGFAGRAVDLRGLHVFAGSQNLSAAGLAEAFAQAAALVVRLAAAAPQPLRYVNLGGGFGVPYAARDTPLDLAVAGAGVAAARAVLAAALPAAETVVELGRYLVAEAGGYVTRVVDRKVSRGTTYLVVDGGLHHHQAAAGLLGQVVRRNYPVALVPRHPAPADERETVTVVGCLCTPLDVLATDVDLPRATVGDLVVVGLAGAYGRTASPTAFLGHPAPVEILL